MKIKLKIKEWEDLTGIRINNPKGFKKARRRHKDIYANRYTEDQFRIAARNSYITIKTQKGLDFMNGYDYGQYSSNLVTQ